MTRSAILDGFAGELEDTQLRQRQSSLAERR